MKNHLFLGALAVAVGLSFAPDLRGG